jgi:hypothetical protein
MTKHITNINLNQKQSQSQKLKFLKALLNGRKITGMEGLTLADSMKTATRLSELRAMGWPIQDEWIRVKSGKKVKRYWLFDNDFKLTIK